jgi:Na+/proline symporter
MLTFLPHGLLGLVVASLIAAYMSTIATHLNWGSSYIVNDFYKRFVRPEASEKQLVFVGRISTVLLIVAACALAPFLENSKRGFDLILQIGAGTGLLFILRWFWWRINAFSEIAAMIASFLVACHFEFVHGNIGLAPLENWQELIIGIAITTAVWVAVTYATKASDDKTLFSFYRLVRPGGPGWKAVIKRAEATNVPIDDGKERWDVPYGILCMVFGCLAVYTALFATGAWIYSHFTQALVLTVAAIVSTVLLLKFASRLRFK